MEAERHRNRPFILRLSKTQLFREAERVFGVLKAGKTIPISSSRAPKTGPFNRLCRRRFRDDKAMIANSCSQEDTMRHVDFSPLYRSTVGFDRLFTMLDSLGQPDQSQTYPPYNIERTGENTYRITMAVAGFDESELSIEAREHTLTVKGEKSEEKTPENQFLYRGIAKRAF